MSRTLSATAARAVFAQETGEALLVLVTLDHAELAAPIRVTSNAVATVSGGNTYLPFPFQVSLPSERDDRPPVVRLSIDNVTREIVAAVRAVTSPPTVTLSVVLASSPNTVEAGPFSFSLRNVEYDVLSVSGELTYEWVLDQPYPADVFSPNLFPGLF